MLPHTGWWWGGLDPHRNLEGIFTTEFSMAEVKLKGFFGGVVDGVGGDRMKGRQRK